MNETRFCGACGQSNGVDARFCGRCGATLAPMTAPIAPAAAPVPTARAAANKTLMAAVIDPQALAVHVAAVQAAQAAGLPEPAPPAPQNPAPPARFDPATGAPLGHAPAPETPRVQYATMIDPPREPASFEARPAPVPEVQSPPSSSKPVMKTMMGMAAFSPATTAAPVASAPLPSAPVPLPSAPVASAPVASAPVASAPVASAPVASAPVASAPVASAPIASAPVASAPVASAPVASAPVASAPVASAVAPTFEPPVASSTQGLPRAPVLSSHADATSSRPRDQILKTMLSATLASPLGPIEPKGSEPSAPASSPNAPTPKSPEPPGVASAPPASLPSAAAPEAARKTPFKTMMGMSLQGMNATAQTAPAPQPTSAQPTSTQGVNPVGPTEAQPIPVRASPATPSAADATEVAAAPAAARKQLGPSNRTMLGVIAPPGAIAAAEARAEDRDAGTQPIAPAPMPYVSSHAPDVGPTGDMSIAGMPSPRRRGNAFLVVALLLGAMLLVGATVAFFMFGMGSHHELAVTPTHTEAGEVLHVEVSGIEAGYRARFSGAELPLNGTSVDFPLPADALHVGDNPLTIDLVGPGGDVETHQVTLTLSYRVRADLAALAATPATILIVVEALPGATVTVDGQPRTLDASGRATHSVALENLSPNAEGMVEYVAHYAITPAGAAAPIEGSLTTRVPVTTLHLDRPGDDVVTDQSVMEIGGTVANGASLTIDGNPVVVLPEGRFLHRYPLPAVGEFSPHIVASAAGSAPAVHDLHIRRVADLAREASSFTYDRTLSYARLAAAPTTFSGQRVMYEGRVYNVDVHDGRGVLQMLVRDCGVGDRCPLWVSYAITGDVTVESWVRIYATVEGEQEFRSTTGENRTVPSVAATFILPARP